jgi:YegS/Rv2252/BmrU family lipid kinase
MAHLSQHDLSAFAANRPPKASHASLPAHPKALFIVNPTAGAGARAFEGQLKRHLSPAALQYEVAFTATSGDGERIAAQARDGGYDIVVAVGGDGTVNEVARSLLHDERTALAIVPTGSGNGVARHLGIPLGLSAALKMLNRPSVTRMDVGRINGHPFFCTAGLGFDAHVSKRFAGSKWRGLLTYARIALQEYKGFKSKPIRLHLGDRSIDHNCYVLAFANAAQYGNNAFIAPLADVADGLLDLCLIDEMPIRRALRVAYGLTVGDLPQSRAATYYKASQIRVRAEEPIGFHVDGDYMGEANTFDVSISPLALRVCV